MIELFVANVVAMEKNWLWYFLSRSQPVTATLNIRSLSSNAFAAKNYSTITVTALL